VIHHGIAGLILVRHCHAANLAKFFTLLCLCHQEV